MPTLKDQQREFSATTRAALLTTLQENPGEWFSAKELAEFTNTGIEEVTPAQIGGLLKFMRDDGLVESKPEMNINVWRLKRGAGATSSQIQAQAPAVSAQGDLRPQNDHKPAPNHPFNVTPAVSKKTKPAPVTRPLPAHLESKPDMAKKKEKPQTYADLRIAEIKGEGLPVKTYPPSVLDALIKEVLPADEPSAALWIPNEPLKITEELNPMPTTTPEQPIAEFKVDPIEAFVHASQPIQPTRPACQGHCANHHHASEEAIDQEAARRQLHEAQVAREAYIAHLLTIADEHASTGDDLGVSPTWKSARRLAPHFGLEASYA